jgi:kynurenine formamidase
MKRGKKYVRVSYDLDSLMPVFAGNPPNRIEKIDSFENGDPWNSYRLTLFNHNGTHIDAPNHFDPNGRKICDYSVDDFVFTNPCLVDIPKGAGACINAEDLAGTGGRDCDILLVRTGFHKMRNNEAYVADNPWLAPSAADFIRRNFKNIGALGIDTISVASCRYPEEGGEAHRILLGDGDYSSSPTMIIEDLNLGLLAGRIKRFYAIPLFVLDADSMPCTAFAEINP